MTKYLRGVDSESDSGIYSYSHWYLEHCRLSSWRRLAFDLLGIAHRSGDFPHWKNCSILAYWWPTFSSELRLESGYKALASLGTPCSREHGASGADVQRSEDVKYLCFLSDVRPLIRDPYHCVCSACSSSVLLATRSQEICHISDGRTKNQIRARSGMREMMAGQLYERYIAD